MEPIPDNTAMQMGVEYAEGQYVKRDPDELTQQELIDRIPDDGFNGDFGPDIPFNSEHKNGPLLNLGQVVGANSDNMQTRGDYPRIGKHFQSPFEEQGDISWDHQQDYLAATPVTKSGKLIKK